MTPLLSDSCQASTRIRPEKPVIKGGIFPPNCSYAASPAAKLFWFDSIDCALGGSQQDDAKILLAHYRAVGGDNGAAAAFAGPVFVTTGYGHVLVRPAPSESNVLNHLHPR
jgi:hypothetical protein